MSDAGTEDDKIEIEIEDDAAEAPAKPETAAPAQGEDGASEDDLADYSDKVKKRINKLTWEKREEQRKREEAEALREEALTYAKSTHAEAERLRKIVEQGEGIVVNQAKQRVEAQLRMAQDTFKRAYENGDADQVAAATAELARLGAEKARLDGMPARKPGPELPGPPAPTPKPAQPAKAQAWVENNPWFNEDEPMQGYALGVNARLIKEGVDPESDVFYTRLDDAMRKAFPDKFGAASEEERPRRQVASVVAPAGRQPVIASRTVKLTPTEVALAKRLGITNEQYAAQKLKLRQNNG